MSATPAELALLVSRGMPVFPCMDKKPLLKDWPSLASADPAQIEEWAARHPGCQWAVVTGERSGVFVVDVDPRHGGDETLARLEDEHGRIETVTAQTPGGGEHLYMKRPAGHRIVSRANALGPGVDVKGDGGYVIVPPSPGPNGRGYVWDLAHHPEDVEIGAPPAWVLSRVNGTTGPAETIATPPESRHDRLRTLTYSWALKGVPENEVREVARALAGSWEMLPARGGEVENLVVGAFVKLRREGKLPSDAAAPLELRTLDLPACMTGTPEPIPWAIHGWLARRDVATLGGEPKTGKSWLALALALCAASGRPWLGTLALDGDPLRVLYVDEEQSERLVRYRLRRLAHGLSISPEEMASLPILYLCGNGVRLDRPEHREAVFQAVEEHRADLVLLDSLVRLHDADENSAREMAGLYGAGVLPLSRQYGAAVLGLHHLTKPHRDASSDLAHRLRGSGDLVAAVDQLWTLERGDGGHLTLRHERSRWADTAAPLDVTIRDTEDGLGVTVTAVTISNVAEDALLGALRDAGRDGALRADLVAAVESAGLKAASKLATKYLGRWKADRTVQSEPEGKARRYWLREHAPGRLLDNEGTDEGTDEGTA